MNIEIFYQHGGEYGMGHKVRCGHLADALQDRGATVTSADISDIANLSWGVVSRPAVIIVDIMENDDDYLRYLRLRSDHLVVIVGAGHTITRETHWIADMVIYQAPKLPDQDKGIPGANVLSGLEYLMIDPRYMDGRNVPLEERKHDVVSYVGGGFDDVFADELKEKLPENSIMFRAGDFDSGGLYPYMSQARAYIGTMGMSVYEAIACGIPSRVVCRSDDHRRVAKRLYIDGVSLMEDAASIYSPSGVDGAGVYRVANKILELARA